MITVVIPTYNERDNIRPLVERIARLEIPGLRMLVVDDNSPDGTGAAADALAEAYPLTVLHRRAKEGLGAAYRDALQRLLRGEFGPPSDLVIHLDADLSHDPAVIPRMLAAVRGADLVLGSRYAPGGGIQNWNIGRQLLSRLANWYCRTVLGMPYRDLTSGFKCYRRGVLAAIGLETLSSIGYNCIVETTYRAHRLGFRIREIPITFTERARGASKLTVGIALESFWRVLILRFSKW